MASDSSGVSAVKPVCVICRTVRLLPLTESVVTPAVDKSLNRQLAIKLPSLCGRSLRLLAAISLAVRTSLNSRTSWNVPLKACGL